MIKIPICDDVESNAPSCISCRRACNHFPECTGFYVNLYGRRKGKCFLKKGKLEIDQRSASYTDICFEKGMQLFQWMREDDYIKMFYIILPLAMYRCDLYYI